jgi:ribosomal protein S12 methylthiotransferase
MYRKQSTPAELLAMVKHLRERVPGITLRTTLLTGFPGENDSDFEALCKFVKAAKFDRLGCFAYSREEGTRSYDMPNQLDEDTKQRRAEVIMEIQTAVSAALLKKKVGTVMEVVVDGYDNKNKVFRGRSSQDAPEIDGIVYFTSPEKHCIGDFVKVKIVKSSEYDLLGELAE